MTTEQTTDFFDENVIEALRAQSRRYDVSIAGELVLSVLPNGVKTWTWVYDNAAETQRKTLGIYPDMSIEDAKKSLATERAAHNRTASTESEFVIRDGRIETVNRKSAQIPIIAAVTIAMITVAALAWLFLRGDSDSARKASATAQLKMDKSVASLSEDLPNPFKEITDPSDTETIQLPQALAPESVTAAAAPVATQSVPAPARNPAALPTPEGVTTDKQLIADKLEQLVTAESTDLLPKITVRQPDSANQQLINRPAPAPAPAEQMPTRQTPPALVAPRQEIVVAEKIPAAAATAPLPTADNGAINPAGIIFDSRVARANLTSAVTQREPIDDLGSSIFSNGAAEQQYFFFTELRELAGQRVRHRWLYNDRIVAEVPFNVGEAWRWRVYSSKTFLSSMTGSWQVQVVLDDGSLIYSFPFTFTQ